jgi:O-antigen/teichoic acid export membrane protein
MPTAIMFWFVNSVSRFILNSYTGLEETGIYSMMITISGIFLLITGSILTAWPPYAMNIAKREDAQIIYARIFQLLLVFLVPLAFFFWSVSEMVILIFSKPIYLIGGKVIILILLQHILYLLYQCGAIGLTLKEKTIYITIGYSISGVITILISLVLCKFFGILGAALSVFFGYLLSIVFILIKSHQFYPVPYDKKFLFIYSVVLLVVLCCTLILSNSNIIHNFIIRFAVGTIFIFIPFITKMVSISEIKSVFEPKNVTNNLQ